MVSPRRKMDFDLAPNNAADSKNHQRSPQPVADPFQYRRNHVDLPSAQVSEGGPVGLFDMSPDMSRHPSVCNVARDDSGCGTSDQTARKDRFGGAHEKQGAGYGGGPLSLYPEPIPRPGARLNDNHVMELSGAGSGSVVSEVASEHTEDEEGRPKADRDKLGSDMMLLEAEERPW
ncbi:hypothetical protein LPJ59_006845, partial [Coemansia sp. RSA 2399]